MCRIGGPGGNPILVSWTNLTIQEPASLVEDTDMASAFACRIGSWWLIGIVSLVGCGTQVPPRPTAPRYIATASPIDIGLGSGLCVAVDRSDERGVWWWQPGAAGCSTRSTGPTLFRAEGANVALPAADQTSAVSFQVPTHSTTTPTIDVRLIVGETEIRVLNSASRVATQIRYDLEIPEVPIRGRRAG